MLLRFSFVLRNIRQSACALKQKFPRLHTEQHLPFGYSLPHLHKNGVDETIEGRTNLRQAIGTKDDWCVNPVFQRQHRGSSDCHEANCGSE